MKKKILIVFTLLLILAVNFGGAVMGEDSEARIILQKSDDLLFPPEATFGFRMEDYEKDKFKRYYSYQGYLKGNNRYLLIGLGPSLIKGTAQLRLEDSIFNYFQKVDVMKQVSAKVAFYYSTLSQEDVMGGKLSNFYNSDSVTKEEENGKSVYVLTLLAKSKEVAYSKIIAYLGENYLPTRRLYFSFSGQEVKQMNFEEIQLNEGRLASMKFTMVDSLKKGFYTKGIFSNVDYNKSIPDTYFTRAYMKVATK